MVAMNDRRRALQRLWTDRCSIYTYQEKTDAKTHITDFQEVILVKGLPCKLSFETLQPADGSPATVKAQNVKLFLTPNIVIPAGSKIVVTRGTRSFTYAFSGEAGIFHEHQEITLELWKGWA